MKKLRRYGGLFLLLALAAQGMPLGGELTVSVHPSLDIARDRLLTEIEGIGSGQSRFRMLFWLSLYAGAMWLLVFRLPRSTMAVVRRNIPLVGLTLLIPLSMLWTSNPRIVATNSAHAVGILAIAIAAAISYRDRPLALVRTLSLILGINVLVHLVTVFLMPEYAINWEGRWRGLWDHPNNLGRMAFFAIAMNAGWLATSRKRKSWVHIILIAGSVLALIGTQSKTATVCAALAGIGPFFIAWTFRNFGRRGAWQMVLTASLVATALSLPLIYFAQDLLEAFTTAIGRDISFTGRTDIWAAAIDAIAEKPLTGWSFDSHLDVIASTYLRFNNYHNAYLDIMVSGGIGALILLAWTMSRYFIRMKDTEPTMVITFLPVSVAILIYSVFEAGLLTGRSTIWIMLLVTVLMQTGTRVAAPRPSRVRPHDAELPYPTLR